jgi:bacteriocin biosynthesis cyclodehydratase domain-containing protein
MNILKRRLRLALPFTTLAGRDTVRLIAGEDFRYSLRGPRIEAWLPEFLEQMDDRQTLETALENVSREHRHAALEVVERLYGERALVDGAVAEAHRAAQYTPVIEGSGKVRERLEANLSRGDDAVSAQARPLPIFCQDRLDYAAALEFNRRCRASKDAWLWVTYGPMARGYISPLFLHDAGPCLHCLVRNFQRLSPAPELYDELIEQPGDQQRMSAVPFPDVAAGILESLVIWKLSAAEELQPPAALYRLHALEIDCMEISTHRVFADPECPDCGRTQ